VPEKHRVAHRRPAQVEIAVLEAELVRGEVLVRESHRQRLGLVQHLELGRDHLDVSGGAIRVAGLLRPRAHASRDADDPLGAEGVGPGEERLVLGAQHHLRDAVAVAQVDEQHAAVVAPGLHPAAEHDLFFRVLDPELAAGVGTQHDRLLLESNRA
jgi:hypothetical protein